LTHGLIVRRREEGCRQLMTNFSSKPKKSMPKSTAGDRTEKVEGKELVTLLVGEKYCRIM